MTNDASDTVSVVNTIDNSLVQTISVGISPRSQVLSPDGTRLYVANFTFCCSFGPGTISVIDTADYSVIDTIPVGNNPFRPSISPDGHYLYIPNYGDTTVSVLDTTTNLIVDTVNVGGNPRSALVNPSGSRIYVTNYADGTISVIDTAINLVIYTIILPGPAEGLVASPDWSKIYVTDPDHNRIQILDTATNQIIGSIDMPGVNGAYLEAINSTGTRLYVVNNLSATVTVIDTVNNESIAVIPVTVHGRNVNGIAITPDDSTVYVTASQDGDTLASIDTLTNTVSAYIQAGGAGASELSMEQQNFVSSRKLTSLAPVKVWIGLKNSDDVGVKFDLKVEAYKDNTLISDGELTSVTAGSSGFNNAKLNTISFNSFSPIFFPAGSQLKVGVYVRNACVGSGHNSGTARLWYNDSQANSNTGATIGSNSNTYYLLNNFLLGTSVGSIKKTIDVSSGAKCSPYKPFGTWTTTP